MTYTPKQFTLPALSGISEKQIAVHLALYEGYVTHTNLIMEKIAGLKADNASLHAYTINELRRRLGFEFDGMRMHEYYFEQFEGGATPPKSTSALKKLVEEKYHDWDTFIAHLREVLSTRGIGWVVVYHDERGNTLHTTFVGDHEFGQLAGLPIVLAIDMWEHAFMVDYVPAEKTNYIDAVLKNLNWEVIENRIRT